MTGRGSTNYNERSWAIDVISHINLLCANTHRSIRRAGGESTIRTDGSSLFPDVLLFNDPAAAAILQGWELKMPDTPIDDPSFVENATAKAETLGLNSFLLWNARTARLYILDSATSRYAVEKTWDDLEHITTRAMVSEHEAEWKALLEAIINDLNELFETGSLEGRQFIESYVSDGVINLILRNHGSVTEALKEAAAADGSLDNRITLWWERVRQEYSTTSRFDALAQANLMNWLGKLLFAHVLRNRDDRAAAVGDLSDDATPAEALAFFEALSNTCNFWTIFEPHVGQHILSDLAWSNLGQLNALLSDISIGQIDQNQLSAILESIASAGSRKLRGQYTTPPELAQLLVRLTLNNAAGRFLDCCCGSGTIPRAALELKLERGVAADEAAGQVWASDVDGQALQLASFALAKPGFMGSVLHVFPHDAFKLKPDEVIDFRDPTGGEVVQVHLGRFHAIGSNLPFISQDGREPYRQVTEQTNQRLADAEGDTAPLPGRSDIAAYLPFELVDLLEPNGRLGIILPNAWLGTAWGERFRRNLIRWFRINVVVTSGAGRWFQNSEIVTNLLILEKRVTPAIPDDVQDEETRFVVLKRRLEEFADTDSSRLCAAQILQGESHEDSILVRTITQAEQAEFRAWGLAGSAQFVDCAWVRELPLIPTKQLFTVRRGERRGCNRLFYPRDEHEIEPEYLSSFIKSSTDIEGYTSVNAREAFCCGRSREELRELGHTGAEAWIARFENARNSKGRPLPEALNRVGHHWYEMRSDRVSELVLPMAIDRRFFAARLDPPAFVDQRLISLNRRDTTVGLDLLHALLNCTITYYMIEGIGFGRGLGVLDLNKDMIANTLHLLDPSRLSEEAIANIDDAFAPIKSREIMEIADELDSPDRQAFDDAVLAAFDIEVPRSVIYDALLTLVSIRHAATDEVADEEP